MAFDQATRNRLSKFVSDTRKLLSEEFSQQMRVKYGLDPATGVVTDIDKLPTMAEGDRQTAQMLRDTLEHYLATAPKRDKKTIATTIDRIVREQAFTVLNRLCAVRMAEARDLVIESIAQGTKSKGFQLYARLAGSALGEKGDAYVCYLFSLFDELSIDLPVLFDRFSPSGRLFPKESVLLEILEQINHHEIQHLWAEDETIGWVYQYFNSQEERRAMRDASSAPRNSRELAVRNQFFTPRYVVEFLTDNTLGRIWYEMTQGQTRLVGECKYLFRQPDEVFLSRMTGRDEEQPSECTIAMAGLLLAGTEDTFPEFGPRDPQLMIDLAHCVDAYATLGDRAHAILENHTFAVRERSIPKPREIADAVVAAPFVFAGDFESLKTQHILEVLFMTCRNDRHGGDGSVYSESWFVGACNEVRRRILNSRRDDLSQDELLRQPVIIPYRPMKDPRDIKMLDPACGSMHFGLYAFDLFLRIYEEAWEKEERLGNQVVVRPRELSSLRDSYATKEQYMLDVPRLIIERNIHGIDIDARAVQIAGLSLWLRAQKAWYEAGIKPIARPQITKSNIVCAESMPGEAELLEQFIRDHLSQTSEKQTIASIVRRIFDAMKIAGESGYILKIEEEIADTISEAKRKWIEGPAAIQLPLFETDIGKKGKVERPLLVAGIDDIRFWDEIETQIYAALEAYGEQTSSQFSKRLFSDDTVKGFAFVDICRKRFDLVLMNPPFGAAPKNVVNLLRTHCGMPGIDLGLAFVQLALDRTNKGGIVGAITSRTFIANDTMDEWRTKYLLGDNSKLTSMIDLGFGVLDDALVEAAAYTITTAPTTDLAHFADVLNERRKETALISLFEQYNGVAIGLSTKKLSSFKKLPGNVVAHWMPTKLLDRVPRFRTLGDSGGISRRGPDTGLDFRFLRLFWEVPFNAIRRGNRWCLFAKGGEYEPYYDDLHLVIKWLDNGYEIRNFFDKKGSLISRPQGIEHMFKRGLTHPRRTTSDLSLRILPANVMFGGAGHGVFCGNRDVDLAFLGLSYSRIFKLVVDAFVGSGDAAFPGSAAHLYRNGLLESLPNPFTEEAPQIVDLTRKFLQIARSESLFRETSLHFLEPEIFEECGSSFSELVVAAEASRIRRINKLLDLSYAIDKLCSDVYFALTEEESDSTARITGPHPNEYRNEVVETEEVARLWSQDISQIQNQIIEQVGAKRYVTKKSYFADRQFELICHLLRISPSALARVTIDSKLVRPGIMKDTAFRLISWAVGVVFGRWHLHDRPSAERAINTFILDDPFDEPRGMLDVEISYDVAIIESSQLAQKVRIVLESAFPNTAEESLQQILGALNVSSVESYLRDPSKFFSSHVEMYSQSRRQAPVYWPLSTPSGNFTVWLSYMHLNSQTLFSIVNDFVEPHLKNASDILTSLRTKAERKKTEEAEMESITLLVSQLEDMRYEMLRVAKYWKPNRNDGVQITAAPLWGFFQNRKWRELLKNTWEELESGQYDWAHLALSIWPDRVVRAAHKDRSMAIAHDLEDVLWHEVEIKKASKSGRVTVKMEWQARELSETEFDAIVQRVKSGVLGGDSRLKTPS
jgi:hypothetical protein